MKPNILRKPVISNQEIEGLLAMRESLDSMRKRYELLEQSVKASEAAIIDKLDVGAEICSGHTLQISEKEIRHVSWKSEFAAVAGAEAAQAALDRTAPTLYRKLIVR